MTWKQTNGLAGVGLLQSQEEWTQRNNILSSTISQLINDNINADVQNGLDVGCQAGDPADMLARQTSLTWQGVDPKIEGEAFSRNGIRLFHGAADRIPFPDSSFDCVVLANVYEHIFPELYTASLLEIKRVMKSGGILVGQLPNPYFLIESHSRLPIMGWLPYRLQKVYWRLTPVPWEHDFYVVTIKDLRSRAESLGFNTVMVRNFNYPAEVIPQSLRWAAQLFAPVMKIMPWAWQFVFRKPAE